MTTRLVSSRIRVGLVGAGPFGRAHARELVRNSDVEFVGVAAPSAHRRDALIRELGVGESVADPAALRTLGVDAVIISAAASVQAEIAAGFLAAGIPALIEKPVATDHVSAETLKAAVASSTSWVMPGHILRFSAPHAELSARVQQGEVGALRSLSFRRHRPSDHLTLFPQVHPVFMTMIHDIDLAMWLTGETLTDIAAWQITEAGAPQPHTVSAQARTASGVRLSFDVSWTLGPSQIVPDAVDMIGAAGMLALSQQPRVNALSGAVDDHLTPSHPYGALAAEQAVFLRAVRRGTAPTEITLDEALHGIEIAQRIVDAAQGERA